MNFVQWLNSLDELLYELMSWLIFFPVTLGKKQKLEEANQRPKAKVVKVLTEQK